MQLVCVVKALITVPGLSSLAGMKRPYTRLKALRFLKKAEVLSFHHMYCLNYARILRLFGEYGKNRMSSLLLASSTWIKNYK